MPEDSTDGDSTGEDETSSTSLAYRGLLIVAVGFGAIAVVVGTVGLYTVLTGGTSGGDSPDVLGEFACEEFDGDPDVGHNASYSIDSEIISANEVESFNGSTNETGVEIELRMRGELLNASARTADGTPVPVQQANNSVRVTAENATPFRLWVDSLAEDTVRTQLDICP